MAAVNQLKEIEGSLMYQLCKMAKKCKRANVETLIEEMKSLGFLP